MSEKKRKRDGQVGDLSSNKKMKEGGEFGSSRETPKIRTSDQVFRKKIRSSKRLGKREREGLQLEGKGHKTKQKRDYQRSAPEFRSRRAGGGASRTICLNCRERGHGVAKCPQSIKSDDGAVLSGCCFNCGNSSHTIRECPKPKSNDGTDFALCFICKKKGHLSAKCPENPNGLYPYGGGCRVCGDKYHFVKDCPLKNKRQFQQEKQEESDSTPVWSTEGNGDYDTKSSNQQPRSSKSQTKPKVIKF